MVWFNVIKIKVYNRRNRCYWLCKSTYVSIVIKPSKFLQVLYRILITTYCSLRHSRLQLRFSSRLVCDRRFVQVDRTTLMTDMCASWLDSVCSVNSISNSDIIFCLIDENVSVWFSFTELAHCLIVVTCFIYRQILKCSYSCPANLSLILSHPVTSILSTKLMASPAR